MKEHVYEAKALRAHIDGSITFEIDLGFQTYQRRNFRLAGVMIVDWERFWPAVEDLIFRPDLLIQSHRTGTGYEVDITYCHEGKWYNFILDLLEAEIARKK